MCLSVQTAACVGAANAFPCVGELCVSMPVGLCWGINSPVRCAWLFPREAQSTMFIPHLRRLLADEDVHMQD